MLVGLWSFVAVGAWCFTLACAIVTATPLCSSALHQHEAAELLWGLAKLFSTKPLQQVTHTFQANTATQLHSYTALRRLYTGTHA
jgi:hypothetical protein